VITLVPLLLALIAHVAADFIFQTAATVNRKNQFKVSGYFRHGITVLMTLLILLQGYCWWAVLLFCLLTTVIHLLLDLLKAWYLAHAKWRRFELGAFIGDQILHVTTIVLIWQCFDWQPEPLVTAFYHWLFAPKLLAVLTRSSPEMETTIVQVLIVFLTYLAVCWGGVAFVAKFLGCLSFPAKKILRGEANSKAGSYIGLIERGLILTLVLNNSLTAVVFVFTAKSIARFNDLNDRDFAEYYLVGTLLSTLLAVGAGLLARILLHTL
jgi:hypothetical protein